MKKLKRTLLAEKIQHFRSLRKSQKSDESSTRRKFVKKEKYCDFQIDWFKYIPTLESRSIVKWEKVEFLSVMGDAPKDFITDKEARIISRSRKIPLERYIAKVGSKYYPIESVIEQLLTEIGQCFEVNIADSKLRMVETQVRFMSKYFLRSDEQLTHGAEILAQSIGKSEYDQIRDDKIENEYFSFQMVCEAISTAFPVDYQDIICGLVEMLAFDALIGHNDRHPYNWGVVVPLAKDSIPKFSPIYDTARALFWNNPEKKIVQMLSNKMQFETYIKSCKLPFCWDGEEKVDFFRLIGLIWNSKEIYRVRIEKFLSQTHLDDCIKVLDLDFSRLMSNNRRELIKRCLRLRQQLLKDAIGLFK
jgi:hypothetical protein